MITNFHSRYWGVNFTLNNDFNFISNLHCFGDYDTTLIFITEELNFEDIDSLDEFNKISDSFFKASYNNFLWLRTDINNVYSLLAEESYFQDYDYNLNVRECTFKNEIASRIALIKIISITFYPSNSFIVEFAIKDSYYSIWFDENKNIDLDY